MRAELPVLSFICAAILAIILSQNLRRSSVANLTLIGWLLACNLLRAINSIIWADNVAIHIPVWCDIVTKILLASNIALPAACLCLLRKVEEISSIREPAPTSRSKRDFRMFDATMCILLPIVYICLHFFVQDRRFDIVEDFGCQAAIYPSTFAIILIWFPPLFICVAAFVFFGFATFNIYCHRQDLSHHLSTSETQLTPKTLICQLSCSAIQASLLAILFVYSMSAEASFGLKPWPSWSAVHEQFSEITTLSVSTSSDTERIRVEFTWWIIPVLSLVYIVFFVLGEICLAQRHSASTWARRLVFKEVDSGAVAMPASYSSKGPPIISMPTISPVHHLPSFWDDASDTKLHRQVQRFPPKRKSDLKLNEYTPPSSPEADHSFKETTLTYVGSPAGRRALDLRPPSPPQKDKLLPPDSVSPRDSDTSHCEVAVKADGTSSIINASWPCPPVTVPSDVSATYSTYSTSGHLALPSPAAKKSPGNSVHEAYDSAHRQDTPFRGSDIPTGTTPPPTPTPAKSILKQVKKRTSGGSIRRNLDSREGNYGLRPEDVIYMTVVKEISA